MAAPHVTGVVAQLLQAHPNWSPEQVREHLTTKCMKNDGEIQGSTGAKLRTYAGLGGEGSECAVAKHARTKFTEQCVVVPQVHYHAVEGGLLQHLEVSSWEECCDECRSNPYCLSWTWCEEDCLVPSMQKKCDLLWTPQPEIGSWNWNWSVPFPGAFSGADSERAACHPEYMMDFRGGDLKGPGGKVRDVPDWKSCCDLCTEMFDCTEWTWVGDAFHNPREHKTCFLKNSLLTPTQKIATMGLVSGKRGR